MSTTSRRLAGGIFLTGLCLLAACSKDSGQVVRESIARGDKYLADNKVAEAIVEYRNAVGADGKSGDARAKLGDAYVKAGDLPNAYREYVRAADLLPDDPGIQVKAASFLLAAEQYPEARARALQALGKDPKNVAAQVLLGNALAGMKDFDGALAELEKAIKTEPTAAGYTSIAQLQLTQRNQAEAEAAYRRAVATDPSSILSRLSLANFLWATGRAPEAEQAFRDAVQANPKDPVANRAVATFLMASGRVDDAEPFLKVVADTDATPDSSQKMALVDYYISTNKLDAATAVLDPLKTNKVTSVRARTRLAYVTYLRKQAPAAHAMIDGVLAEQPTDAEALVTKARFLASDGKLEDALAVVTKATTADPRSAQAWLFAGLVRADRNEADEAIEAFNEVLKLNPRSNTAKVRLAKLFLAKGQLDSAVANAQEAVAMAPSDGDAQLTLARGLIARKDLTSAEPIVNALLTTNQNSALVHATAGGLAAAKGNWPGAERAFTRALELNGQDPEALGGLIASHMSSGKTNELRSLLERTAAGRPSSAQLMLAARAYLNLNDNARAKSLLERAITNTPNNPDAYELLGKLFVSEGKLDEARAQFEQVAQKNPKSAGAQTMLGMVLQIQNKNDEARQRYERALQLDANAGIAANNLASIYADSGQQLDVALQLAQTAVRTMPEHAAAADTLGWVFYKQDLANLAIEPFRRATQLDGRNPLFHFHLGLAYAKAGDKARARVSLGQALKLQADFPGANEAKRALSAL